MLRQLPPPPVEDENVIVSFGTADDAAIYRLSDDTAMVLTVDFFPPIVDDPFDFGAIAAANALSDVYAMGGRPITALNIVAFPDSLPHEVLAKILTGGAHKAAEAGVIVVGGHTLTDDEPKFGMAITGLVHPDRVVTNAGARAGDRLVLTKPIGTGVITTAGKAGEVSEEVLAAAVEVMLELNADAADAMKSVGVNAATDITGYGLAGHLAEITAASGVAATLSRSAVPVIPGTLELLAQGIVPGGTHRNLAGMAGVTQWDAALTEDDRLLLCDAQTSGGLLIAVAADRTDDLVANLIAAGTPAAAIVGEITRGEPGAIIATP